MDEDTLQDLKQFITGTISQQLALQTGEIKQEIRDLDKKLSERIDDLDTKLDTIANTIGAEIEEDNKKLENNENRITRLEQKID